MWTALTGRKKLFPSGFRQRFDCIVTRSFVIDRILTGHASFNGAVVCKLAEAVQMLIYNLIIYAP